MYFTSAAAAILALASSVSTTPIFLAPHQGGTALGRPYQSFQENRVLSPQAAGAVAPATPPANDLTQDPLFNNTVVLDGKQPAVPVGSNDQYQKRDAEDEAAILAARDVAAEAEAEVEQLATVAARDVAVEDEPALVTRDVAATVVEEAEAEKPATLAARDVAVEEEQPVMVARDVPVEEDQPAVVAPRDVAVEEEQQQQPALAAREVAEDDASLISARDVVEDEG